MGNGNLALSKHPYVVTLYSDIKKEQSNRRESEKEIVNISNNMVNGWWSGPSKIRNKMHVRKSINVENGTCKHATGGGWTCCFQHEKHQQTFLIWTNSFDFKLHGRSSWSHKRELKIVIGSNLLVLLLCPYSLPFSLLLSFILLSSLDIISPSFYPWARHCQ